MHKSSTRFRGKGLAVIGMATVLSGCGAPDTDPRLLAQMLPPPVVREVVGIEPEVGTVVAEAALGARPLGEMRSSGRLEAPDMAQLVIGVGQLVDDAIDHELRRSLSRNLDGTAEWRSAPDRDVVEMLMVGRAELGLIGGELSGRELRAGLRQTPVAVELFALAVPSASHARSLTSAQVRQVLTGQVRKWSQLGHEGGDIVVVAPADRSLAERAARSLMPGDSFASLCVRVAGEHEAVDHLLRNPDAIAVVRAGGGAPPQDARLLQIDWAPPTPEAFTCGSYPFGVCLHLVSNGAPDARVQQVLTFFRTAAGQQMLGRTRAPLQ